VATAPAGPTGGILTAHCFFRPESVEWRRMFRKPAAFCLAATSARGGAIVMTGRASQDHD
jgi:hypothetical protein